MNNLLARQRLPAEPRLLAIGGGAGGTGRSTFAADLGRILARRGRRVLLVDSDIGNPNLHIRLAADVSDLEGATLTDVSALEGLIAQGGRGRPSVLPLGLARRSPYAPLELRAQPFVAALRSTDFDEIIIDLPAAPDPLWTTVFVLSDVPTLLVPTETVSLLGAVRYVRAAIVHALLAHPDAEAERHGLIRALDGLPSDPGAADFAAALATPALRTLHREVISRLELYLVLGQTREAAERELGHAFALSLSHLLDVWPRYLGALDHDERRWFRQRHDQRGQTSAEVSAEGTCDEVAKRLQDLAEFDAEHPRLPRDSMSRPWQRIGVSPDLDPVTMRQTYRRLWEGLRRESPLTSSVLPGPLREAMIRELEDANRELHVELAESSSAVPVVAEVPARPVSANPGERLRAARTERELSQRELSLRTKIGLRVLDAIECFEVDALPRPVYLRGYLREIAGELGLDPERVMDDYLTAVSEHRNARILSRSSDERRRS